jgi:aspartate ammonia-lyase
MAGKKSDYRFERGSAIDGHPAGAVLWGSETEHQRNYVAFSGDYKNQFLDSVLIVKKVAAQTNASVGTLDATVARTISQCCDEILSGQWRDQFFLNSIFLGADAFLQDNVNEVLANRGTVIMGGQIGKYQHVHPDMHVQLNQNYNQVFQVALRLTLLTNIRSLQNSLLDLERLLRRKSLEFERHDTARDLKTIGTSKLTSRKFNIFGSKIERCVKRVNDVCQNLLELGWTHGKNSSDFGDPLNCTDIFVEKLKTQCGIQFKISEFSGDGNQAIFDFVELSSALKELALELRYICQELRHEVHAQKQLEKLVNIATNISNSLSGGLTGNIANNLSNSHSNNLTTNLPGSLAGGNAASNNSDGNVLTHDGHLDSLTPLYTLSMVALDVVGKDVTVTLCAQESGNEKQVLVPLIAETLLSSIDSLSKALPVFNTMTLQPLHPQNQLQSNPNNSHIAQAAHRI